MKSRSKKVFFGKTATAVSLATLLGLSLACCSCAKRKTSVDAGKIEQGERISWSVSYKLRLLSREEEDAPITYLSACGKEDVWAASRFGAVYHFDGSSWLKEASLDSILVRSLYAADRSHVWVGGEEAVDYEGTGKGIILFFNGESWVRQLETGEGKAGLGGFIHMEGSGPDNVWAVNTSSSIYRYDGRVWERVGKDGASGDLAFSDEDSIVTELLVGDDGIPVISPGGGSLFYFDHGDWHPLPEIPEQNFRTRGLSGDISWGIWVSGVSAEEPSRKFPRSVVYRFQDGQWMKILDLNERGISKCAVIEPATLLVLKQYVEDIHMGIEDISTKMLYFDGSSWSEQGSIKYRIVWDIESVGGDTIWLVDGERIIKGEILD